MNGTQERYDFEESLVPMLRDAVGDLRPHGADGSTKRVVSRRRRVGLLAATVVLVAGGALVGGAAFGDRHLVSVDGLQAVRNPDEVERQLLAAGIDASIIEVPLPAPSPGDDDSDGEWWWITADRPQQLTEEEFRLLYAQVGVVTPDTPRGDVHVLELPKLTGHVTLYVGRATRGSFTVASYDRINELSPLGTFYCLGEDPNDPVALGEAIEQLGYRVMWMTESDNVGQTVSAPPPGWVATWAFLRAPDLVDIRLAPKGPEGARYQADEGTYPRGTTPPWAPPCA